MFPAYPECFWSWERSLSAPIWTTGKEVPTGHFPGHPECFWSWRRTHSAAYRVWWKCTAWFWTRRSLTRFLELGTIQTIGGEMDQTNGRWNRPNRSEEWKVKWTKWWGRIVRHWMLYGYRCRWCPRYHNNSLGWSGWELLYVSDDSVWRMTSICAMKGRPVIGGVFCVIHLSRITNRYFLFCLTAERLLGVQEVRRWSSNWLSSFTKLNLFFSFLFLLHVLCNPLLTREIKPRRQCGHVGVVGVYV